jgi:flagellar basal-body rod modification protein FlgD
MVNNISGLGPSSGTGVLSAQGGSFGDNPFLQLLIAELRNQTPLEPVDNASFMQQIAAFSSMQEQKELNSNMLQLLDFQGVLARLQGLSEGSNLLGKVVTYEMDGKAVKGPVTSVFVNENGEVRVRVGDDEIGMRQIIGIEQPGEEPSGDTSDESNDKTNS